MCWNISEPVTSNFDAFMYFLTFFNTKYSVSTSTDNFDYFIVGHFVEDGSDCVEYFRNWNTLLVSQLSLVVIF